MIEHGFEHEIYYLKSDVEARDAKLKTIFIEERKDIKAVLNSKHITEKERFGLENQLSVINDLEQRFKALLLV